MSGLTNIAQTQPFTILDAARAVRFDNFTLEDFDCPVILFDHVRMKSAGFPPHPHAGLCVDRDGRRVRDAFARAGNRRASRRS